MPLAALVAILLVAYLAGVFGSLGDSGVTKNDLRTLAMNAGFQGEDVTTAVAIALAESGGNPYAYNPETLAGTPEGMGSVGLWQIYLKAHPEYSKEQLQNPQANADAAFAIYQEAGGFSPWSTYNSGRYTAFLEQATGVIEV